MGREAGESKIIRNKALKNMLTIHGFKCAMKKKITNEFVTISKNVLDQLKLDVAVVTSYLELGDDRLLAGDGPVGNQLPELYPHEWNKVYEACRRITAVNLGENNESVPDMQKQKNSVNNRKGK